MCTNPLKADYVRADTRAMPWLIGIATVCTSSSVMAIALCVAAGRGDRRVAVALATVPDPRAEVDFVATFAEPAPTAPVRAPAAQRSNL